MSNNPNNRNRRPGTNSGPSLDDEEAWFAPRKRGIGSGVPIRWQGWALIAAYVLTLIGISLPGKKPDSLRITLIFAVTAVFLLITARKTKGGWRWRNGDDR
ncbi:MAG: hypothetical protein DI568_06130 [Sphingomonas sp.]|nr:MAG: hypothetical protein DI568_06130 [Sphingomonas sp.]